MHTWWDRPWLASYPAGVPAEVKTDLFPSLVALIEAAVPEAREIEVAVLGNDDPQASVVGEDVRDGYQDALAGDLGDRDLQPGAGGARPSPGAPG